MKKDTEAWPSVARRARIVCSALFGSRDGERTVTVADGLLPFRYHLFLDPYALKRPGVPAFDRMPLGFTFVRS